MGGNRLKPKTKIVLEMLSKNNNAQTSKTKEGGKKTIYVLLASIIISALLCSCGNKSKIAGAWQGDGSLDMLGMDAPYEFATLMEFDGMSTLVVTNDEGTIEFTYSMTDDTLTLSDGEMSWGVSYTIKGNTLSIKTGDGFAIFNKVK